MKRPCCRRCGGLLDLWYEPVEDEAGNMTGKFRGRFACNNFAGVCSHLQTDEEFQRYWDNLPGDDVARLERQLQEEE